MRRRARARKSKEREFGKLADELMRAAGHLDRAAQLGKKVGTVTGAHVLARRAVGLCNKAREALIDLEEEVTRRIGA